MASRRTTRELTVERPSNSLEVPLCVVCSLVFGLPFSREEVGYCATDRLGLSEAKVPSGFQSDEPGSGDSLGGGLGNVV